MKALFSQGIWKECRHLTLHRTLQPKSTFTHIISFNPRHPQGHVGFFPFYRWEGWGPKDFLWSVQEKKEKQKPTGNEQLRTQGQGSDPSLWHGHPWPGIRSGCWSLGGLRKFRKQQIRRWQTGKRVCSCCLARNLYILRLSRDSLNFIKTNWIELPGSLCSKLNMNQKLQWGSINLLIFSSFLPPSALFSVGPPPLLFSQEIKYIDCFRVRGIIQKEDTTLWGVVAYSCVGHTYLI